MAYHGVLIPEAIAALNIDSLNRSVVDTAGSAIDNGWIFTLGAKSTTAGESEVFELVMNASASPLNMWMAYSGDEIVLTDARYKGLDPDPRNFFNAAGKVFSAYKPQVGDIILATAECFSNSFSSHTYAVGLKDKFNLTFANAVDALGLAYKVLATKYISLATGAIDSQRVTAYELECIQI